ncbi:MAG TPA: hypothetical protein VIP11_00800 [Gemmatimonadaceae bacterium]
MSRFIFAALGSFILTGAAAAQRVPGRDLLEFPLGLLAEAAPLSSQMIGGLWNPATGALRSPSRAALGFAGLTTPQEQGVRLNQLAGAYNVRPNLTAQVSVASASISDLFRTETDPLTRGSELSYSTTLFSLGLAGARKDMRAGFMARYRRGNSDSERRGTFGVDGGVIFDRVVRTPVRFAASTFLFTPGGDEATYAAAADVPLFARDSVIVIRVGEAISYTQERGREGYSFATARYHGLDLSGGVSQSSAFGNSGMRLRLGCGLRYGGYTVAIAREDGAAGFGASYQFLFTRIFP